MNAKEKIKKTLKDFGKTTTSRIAGIIGLDYVYATNLLNELEEKKEIKKEVIGRYTFWELK